MYCRYCDEPSPADTMKTMNRHHAIRQILAATGLALMLGTVHAAGGEAAAGSADAQVGATPQVGFEPSVGQSGKDVIWVPTPQVLVDEMLRLAEITPEDYLVDLGSGDGRTVITAAQRGTRAHGVEFNPDMVEYSRRAAQEAGVADMATFTQGDIFETDFSDATVVTLFLLPRLNLKLRPTLLDMKPGTRVVSNSFDMDDWEPDETGDGGAKCQSYCRAYKWVVPAKVAGTWQLDDNSSLTLEQKFQKLSGHLVVDGKQHAISDAVMKGAHITFTADGRQYTGEVDAERMSGQDSNGKSWNAKRSL